MRKVGFRYNLLRGGAYYAQLRALDSSTPHLRMDEAADIKSSFTGTFAPFALDADWKLTEINWLTDEIQPALVINGRQHPLGVFSAATPAESEDSGLRCVRVEAYDRGWRVRDTKTETLLFWPAGTPVLDAVAQLLTAAGIRTVFKTPSDAVFPEAREDWDVGTSFLDIINQLLGEINYNSLRFDLSGAAILSPASVPMSEQIAHFFDGRDASTRLLPKISRVTDIYSAPNVWICVCANPDKGGLMTATAANDNPQSPLSTVRRGRRICRKVQVNNIASQEELQKYANRLRDQSMVTGETISIETGLLPGFCVGDVTALHFGELTALCVERGIDMDLTVGGLMRHRLERVVYNLE